jgi:hypothetical protein
MLGRAFLALLFAAGVLTPVIADQGRVSEWLVQGHDDILDTVSAARLAMLCQRWPLKPDKAGFVRMMRDRAGILPPADRDYVAQVIHDGEAQASDSYGMAAMSVCMSLAPAQLVAAAKYVDGRIGLRGLVQAH